MSTDFLDRLEQPAYTGENRCAPCTLVNLAIAVVLAILAGRRNRALGLLVFLGGAGLVYLRGYLVPGTPELTKRYLPESVLSMFGTTDRPDAVPDEIATAANRRLDTSTESAESAESRESGDLDRTDSGIDDDAVDGVDANGIDADGRAGADDDADDESPGPYAHRGAVEELLDNPMDVVLEGFDVVEAGGEGTEADIVLVDSFREEWLSTIELLEDDEDERLETLADLFHEPTEDVELERREDTRLYGLVDGKSRNNWISEAALVADLAAHRVLAARDPRWSAVVPEERYSILKGFRVFLETCPLCGGPVEPTDEAVESCCDTWDVIAVRCLDCDARVLEVTPPEPPSGGDPMAAGAPGRFTR
jgi:hypothetical protein